MEKLLLQNFTPNMPNFQTTRTLKKLNQTFSENILLNKKDAENKIMFQN